MRIAIFGKPNHHDFREFLEHLYKSLSAQGCEVLTYEPFSQATTTARQLLANARFFSTHQELSGQADYLFSIGGDGTLLDTVSLVRNSGIPVLGINLGRLGFLSSIARDEIDKAIQYLLNTKVYIDQRSLLKLDLKGSTGFDYALNELSILKEYPSSMLTISTYVNDTFLNSYWADGLIVATPTGSTAYSLSCGGPILTPDSNNFVITPVATHNLTMRPIVLPDSSIIKIKVEGREHSYLLGLDSRIQSIHSKEELVISKAGFTLNLVRMPEKDFFSTLRAKLSWGKDIRN